jgi:hypothetical protein
MADDDHPDAEVAGWLEVEPLDDVTRRRLVSTALSESEPAAAPSRPSHLWRWVAAAAAVIVVLVGTLVIVTANGGHDEPQANRSERTSLSPKAVSATPDAGDFGNLDDPGNLAALRAALDASTSSLSDASRSESAAGAQAAAPAGAEKCAGFEPAGTVVARATGTIDQRAAVVYLVRHDDGSRTLVAVLEDPCALRDLGAA